MVTSMRICNVPKCYNKATIQKNFVFLCENHENVELRIEKDSLGEVEVPQVALWGAQTQRSLFNFSISGITFPTVFLESLVRIKRACANVNVRLGQISEEIGKAIISAADKVLNEEMWEHFPLDIMQTGSGTQTNMNANEVLANLASELLGGTRGKKEPVHPNDHVNKGQSSNDIIPAAMYVSAAVTIKKDLLPALNEMITVLQQKEQEFKDIIKIGRTHLQDAVPLTLGQEFSGYVHQLLYIKEELEKFLPVLCHLPIGGTAVGTGLNAHPKLGELACEELSKELGLPFRQSENLFMDIAAHDRLVTASSHLRTLAVILIKIANDLRWLASGPRCGLGELSMPANEPGSSIMPGKVNPTQAEALVQVGLKVIGNDSIVSMGGFFGGQLDLNTAKPLMIYSTLESITMLSNAMRSFSEKALKGLRANRERIQALVEQSLMLATALTPYIGYDRAAKLAQKAFQEGKTIKEVALEENVLPPAELEKALDLKKMVRPHQKE